MSLNFDLSAIPLETRTIVADHDGRNPFFKPGKSKRLKESAMNICIFCHQNGETAKAKFVAPQCPMTEGGPWEYQPVCEAHADGWWDGSDYPDGQGAPAIIMIDASETIAIAIQATLDSVRCSPEPITGEEAMRMLDERLQDDGVNLRIQFERAAHLSD